ncbi:5,10-dihydrophenazine-1-carboxylate 9-dimethylallyltransferase (plasmid) [Streptomyces xanthophaeus]|uniref:aromatic prenyltransferase n=1 Tax=Streptomyces xanthophaeus TaxID=67385 RepID=UPI00233EFEA5|nr:aromatic prenyltransferase [Streptomyces xanthophaeus]WCD91416.1 5,10-dihydrophenazine-1-carboxylate 9-dimethylallyltransferase [Streptomyces xanthophaeus]
MTRTDMEGLYSAIEETAGLLGVSPSRDKVWPILSAYEDSIQKLVVAFRVTTRDKGDLDCRFTALPGDVNPYEYVVAQGLSPKTDHPVATLLTEVQEHFPTIAHGVDFGVIGGFKKTWTFLPANDLQKLSKLAEFPSMAPSLAENLDFYARYGLDDKLSMIGIDYPSRTVNVYFLGAPPECREPETVRAMLRDLGLPEPSEQMLQLAQQAGGIYTTLSWDSPKIERITFATMVPDAKELPARIDVAPNIEQFAKNVGHTYEGTAKGLYNVASYAGGEYFKLQTYYQLGEGSVEAKGLLRAKAG